MIKISIFNILNISRHPAGMMLTQMCIRDPCSQLIEDTRSPVSSVSECEQGVSACSALWDVSGGLGLEGVLFLPLFCERLSKKGVRFCGYENCFSSSTKVFEAPLSLW